MKKNIFNDSVVLFEILEWLSTFIPDDIHEIVSNVSFFGNEMQVIFISHRHHRCYVKYHLTVDVFTRINCCLAISITAETAHESLMRR